jgi:gamma-glutamyltranspeptidase/glutathione hydrolase
MNPHRPDAFGMLRHATPLDKRRVTAIVARRAARAACAALLLAAAMASPAAAQQPPLDRSQAPEASTGYRDNASTSAVRFMVATANPLATAAAHDVLVHGGTAVDAAIAAQMMLTLVEPQSSGIGGGAFLLTYDAASQRVAAWDGRETAPMAVDDRLFLDAGGGPLPFFAALVGGRAVGVPGVARMLEAAHRESGKLPWAALLQPAIVAAEQGFTVSPRLHALVAADRFLRDDPVAAAHFHDPQGAPVAEGSRLRNPELARTLKALAEHGARAFYDGPLAALIVDKVRSHPRNPGSMTVADLASYRAIRREPVCAPWLRWVVCGMPPPSSGGIAVAQILGILSATGFDGLTDPTGSLKAAGLHLFSEAGRLAYADRDRYLADSDFVSLPAGLLEPAYLASRAGLIGERSMGTADQGTPAPGGYPEGGTSHVSVVDSEGNAASLTTSIESAFGSRQMVGGFLLNNQLTDFSFPGEGRAPAASGGATSAAQAVANRPQAGKRPRSSMAPTLVFERTEAAAAGGDDAVAPDAEGRGRAKGRGRLAMVTGSPGGSAIINYVAKVLVATLQGGLDPRAAIALPNIGSRNGPTELERGRVSQVVIAELRKRGHEIREIDMTSGVQTIFRDCTGESQGDVTTAGNEQCVWIGAADPRREGVARGG